MNDADESDDDLSGTGPVERGADESDVAVDLDERDLLPATGDLEGGAPEATAFEGAEHESDEQVDSEAADDAGEVERDWTDDDPELARDEELR